jgi:undecaprenyl-diphosphatase
MEQRRAVPTVIPALSWPAAFARLDEFEVRVCRPANRVARRRYLRRYFALVSRLGDGIGWYAVMAALLMWGGSASLAPVLHMVLTGVLGVLVYKLLKRHLVRERPFFTHRGVRALVPPLDRYSFPSGHTLHAVCGTVMLAHYFPALLWLVVPFTLSVAASRVVLGLHYPSDVLAGAAIGWSLAELSLRAVG